MAAADYRQRARRLRSRFRNDPIRLQWSLKELSKSHDRGETYPRVKSQPTSHVERFTSLVASRIDGPVLPYSMRLGLIKEAQRQGIDRFDANLIIARVQHRVPTKAVDVKSKQLPKWFVPLVTAAVVQSLILAGVWLLLL
jgi:hypothetical protein